MISTRTPVTADTLNDVVEFDSPFTVHPDGTVTDADTTDPAPELYDVVNADDFHSTTWELVTGYSGQDRYAGPIMHDSEQLGGGMARDVLATPGTYVVVPAYYTCTDDEHADGTPVTDDDPRETFTDAAGVVHTYVDHGECETHGEGWALARLITDRCEVCGEVGCPGWSTAHDDPTARRIAAGVRDGNLSWSDVADQSARGWCPASPEGTDPHIVTDGATCDECGATV